MFFFTGHNQKSHFKRQVALLLILLFLLPDTFRLHAENLIEIVKVSRNDIESTTPKPGPVASAFPVRSEPKKPSFLTRPNAPRPEAHPTSPGTRIRSMLYAEPKRKTDGKMSVSVISASENQIVELKHIKSELKNFSIPGAELSEELSSFIQDHLIPREAYYFKPGVGIDPKSGMPYDHIRVRREEEMLAELGNYTAASKLSLSIPFLVGVIQNKPEFANVVMDENTARELLEKALRVILSFQKDYPDYHGFLPWADIKPVGKLGPASNKMPSLDNGQLTWALTSVLASFEDSKNYEDKKLAELAKSILANQNYKFFYDANKGLLHGTIQMDFKTRAWTGDSTYYLNDMCEGILAVLWAILHGQVPEDAWDNILIPTVDYTSANNEKVTTLLGFRASFHENWALIYLPLMETELAKLYRNYLYVQADHANKKKMPGFISTAYDSRGNYRQMGIQEIAAQKVDRDDVAVVFATALAMLIDQNVGATWLKSLYAYQGLLTNYGAVESVAPDGFADAFTADGKGVTLMGVTGGVVKELKAYLTTHHVPGTSVTMYEKFRELVTRKYKQMEKAREGKPVYSPTLPYPMPPEEVYEVRVPEPKSIGAEYRVLRHLQNGHLHGKNVSSIGFDTLEDDLIAGDPFVYNFSIPPTEPSYEQWAYRGTYIDEAVRIADMKFLNVTIPVNNSHKFFEIELKADDINLVVAQIDTAEPGVISPDGEWKTIVKAIKPIPEAEYKLFNYFAVVNPNPRYLIDNVEYASADGVVFIKELWLSAENTVEKEQKKSTSAPYHAKPLPDAHETMPYWRMSHGNLSFLRSALENRPLIRAGNGWRGGYMPYVDIEKYPFVRITVRNVGERQRSNRFRIELKHEDIHLLGSNGQVIEVRNSRKPHTFEFEIFKPAAKTANYLAIVGPVSDVEILSISFGATPDPDESVERVLILPEFDGKNVRIR